MLTLLISIIITTFTISCRPTDLSVRPARVIHSLALEETDSTAFESLKSARIVNDTTLILLDPGAKIPLLFNMRTGHVLEERWILPDLISKIVHQLPDEYPEFARHYDSEIVKMDLWEGERYVRDYKDKEWVGGLSEYTVTSDGELVTAIVGIAYPYHDRLGRVLVMPSTCLVLYTRKSAEYTVSPLMRSLEEDFAPIDYGLQNCGRFVWVSAWDYDPQAKASKYVRSLRYTSDGKYTGVTSTEPIPPQNKQRYRDSYASVCPGLDSTHFIRTLSKEQGVDIVRNRDGRTFRIPLPESAIGHFDTLATTVVHPIRFAENKIAVHIFGSQRFKAGNASLVVVGEIQRGGYDINWNNVLECTAAGLLLGLVDTNNSPIHRRKLMAIFEDPKNGPYLASIALE